MPCFLRLFPSHPRSIPNLSARHLASLLTREGQESCWFDGPQQTVLSARQQQSTRKLPLLRSPPVRPPVRRLPPSRRKARRLHIFTTTRRKRGSAKYTRYKGHEDTRITLCWRGIFHSQTSLATTLPKTRSSTFGVFKGVSGRLKWRKRGSKSSRRMQRRASYAVRSFIQQLHRWAGSEGRAIVWDQSRFRPLEPSDPQCNRRFGQWLATTCCQPDFAWVQHSGSPASLKRYRPDF